MDSSAYGEFLAVAEDLNLRILQILEDNGVHLAVPVQQWVDNTEDSTATVQRSQDEALPFPDFSDDDKVAMKGSLDYPYKGRENVYTLTILKIAYSLIESRA